MRSPITPILAPQAAVTLNSLRNSGPKYRTNRIRHAAELASHGATKAEIAAALGIKPERAAYIAGIVEIEEQF